MAIKPVAVPFPADNTRVVQPKAPTTDADILTAGGASATAPNASNGAFNVYRYPADIGTDEQPHYVMFFITLRESDIANTEIKKVVINGGDAKFDKSQSNDISKTSEATLAYGGAMAVSAGLGGIQETAKSLIGGTGTAGNAIEGTLRTAAARLVTVDVLKEAAKGRDQIILKDAIALYLNGKPSTSYKASWQDQELGVIGGISTQNPITGVGDFLQRAGNIGAEGAMSYILQNSKGPIDGAAAGAFQVAAGQAPNPFKAQLFKSMNFRTFSFDYIFLPKNEIEYASVQNIIKTFKKYMHPKLSSTKFIMNYPAEFNIVYYHKEQTNNELFRIANCALTDLSVEYGGTDFTTFKGTDGAPTEIAMKLTFTELELLSRDRIETGGF